MESILSEGVNQLSGDRPETDPARDRFGYASFARHLAHSLAAMVPSDGIVVAVFGPWGSGKSTLLNFLEHYLADVAEEQRPVVVKFNPWWFSGHEDLAKRLLKQLSATLGKDDKLKRLKTKISKLAEAVSDVPLQFVPFGKDANEVAKAIAKAMKPPDQDVPALKDAICSVLRDSDTKVLVLIDDIDRLTAEEVRQVLRAVKAVADFPNVIYLLAFDRDVAARAVERVQEGVSGHDYLEKIIQVPFELPLPDKVSIQRQLFERLDLIIAGTPDELFDQSYWTNVYYDGLDQFFSTPRDVVRLANTLAVTYGASRGEVNPVDFIAIEVLRVFCPSVYDAIRRGPERFTDNMRQIDAREPESERTFHDSWLSQVDEKYRPGVKALMLRLFPRLGAVWANTYWGAEREAEWRRSLRVCSAHRLPCYFRLAVPEGNITNREMNEILETTGIQVRFSQVLLDLANQHRPDGRTRVSAVLNLLQDYTSDGIPEASISAVIRTLFDIGDQLIRPEDEFRSFMRLGNDARISLIISNLLQRLPEPERFRILSESIEQGRSLSTIVREVSNFGEAQGKYESRGTPEAEALVTAEHLTELEQLAVAKIRTTLLDATVIPTPPVWILQRWMDWGDKQAAREWVARKVESDAGLADLLVAALFTERSVFSGDRTIRESQRLDMEMLSLVIDVDGQRERVSKLAESEELSERQRTAARQFIEEDRLRKNRTAPDSQL